MKQKHENGICHLGVVWGSDIIYNDLSRRSTTSRNANKIRKT